MLCREIIAVCSELLKQDRQCMLNITLRRVHVNIDAVVKQKLNWNLRSFFNAVSRLSALISYKRKLNSYS